MKIRNNTQQINTNFKAIDLSQIKIRLKSSNEKLILYKLQKNDIKFCHKLINRLDLEKLAPQEKNKKNLLLWQNIINNAIHNIKYNDEVILATHKNKPCGLINYAKLKDNNYYVLNLATWPICIGEKAPFAGQALIEHLFKDAIKNNIKKISLSPNQGTVNGKSCIDFYKKLGFIFDKITMSFEADKIELSRRIAQIENNIEYKEVKISKNTDLNKILSLRFKKGYFAKLIEKIKDKFKK